MVSEFHAGLGESLTSPERQQQLGRGGKAFEATEMSSRLCAQVCRSEGCHVLLCAKCCVEGGGYRMGGGLPTAASVGPGAEEETRCHPRDSAESTINSAVGFTGEVEAASDSEG